MSGFRSVKSVQMGIDKSSLINHIEWHKDKTTNQNDPTGSLVLTFTNNDQYEYTKVPASVLDELLESESVGSYFCQNIKDQYKTYKYITEDN